ncbi:1-phosphofructokinase family hexose kinase [Micromonospora chokoriensis]
MIVTVTLNPALDLTYTVDALIPHGTHRVSTVAERPGGKGLNVATVLRTLGEPVLATGLLGGATGGRVEGLLTVPAAFVPIGGETRRTVTVADGVDATGFSEPGPRVTAQEWAAFTAHFAEFMDEADVVALSGSLPPGVPADGYATLIRLAADRGVRSVLDTSGEALRLGLTAGPELVKPNATELAGLLSDDRPRARDDEIADADRARSHGAREVVVSRGPRGLLALTRQGSWRGVPSEHLLGNPTGAGDACVAALSRGLRRRTPWPRLLADAVALSAAAVVTPVAGAVDLDTYRRLLPAVHVSAA